MRLCDIITVSDVRLVIEIDDADRDPKGIAESFIFTEEAEKGLRSILKRIDEGKGCGAFIKGNFGSGKSHFLSFLYLILKNKDHPVINDYGHLKRIRLNLIKIPLVRYPASLSLEKILLQYLNCNEDVKDREALFKGLLSEPTVILIDELSEFLRSKESPPHFYEDVRFLQFLGEFAMRHPLWIIASLQEWIEETGHISSNMFNRIKDRYPLKINLSASHIEELIDRRLIIKKDNSSGVIRSVFDELKRFYPSLELKLDKFRKTYPLHPFTTRFLSGLTTVFSQHRGIIQFVQSEVKKRLYEPCDMLITPDAIFDHFEDRIREIQEFSPFVRTVYDYYRSNIDSIFNNPLQRETALSAIKVMILTELSPLEKRKTAKDIAEILLKKISTLTEGINYDYIKNGILEPLVAHQMYIMKEDDRYFVDASVDEGIKIKARIKAIRERFLDKDYLFSQCADLVSLPYLPLHDVKNGRRYRFNWLNSMRDCIVVLLKEVNMDDIERFLEAIKNRVDGYLVLLTPYSKTIPSPNIFTLSPLMHLIIFWQPRRFTDEETLFLEEYIAKKMLIDEFPSLKDELKRDEPLFRDIITKVYFEGSAFPLGRKEIEMKDIGYLPMEKLLTHLFDPSMREVYPDYQRIMPMVSLYSSHHISSLFNHFIRLGRITVEDAERRGIAAFIRGIMEPLSIVTKKGNSYTLSIAPDNEIISFIFEFISHEHNLHALILNLKRSSWGLIDEQINLILGSLMASGYIIPYRGHEIYELKEITQLSSGEITSIKPGRTIDHSLISAIPKGRFIWGDIESSPTPATQKLMWKEAAHFIRRYRGTLDEVRSLINRYREYSIFKLLNIDTSLLNRLTHFVQSTGLNLSPQEGIERVLIFLRDNPDIEDDLSYIERLHKFLSEEFQLVNKYYLYLTHPSLMVKDELLVHKQDLISRIDKFLKELSEFDEIRNEWERFYDSFSSVYKNEHDRYYESPVFILKREFENRETTRVLKKIAHIISSITFDGEWWDIKKHLDKLPERCNADLNHELFLNPVCRCGFGLGMQPPVVDIDLSRLCEDGIRNFIKVIQSPENREKIDSTITGLHLSRKVDIAERLFKLLNIKPDKTSMNMIIPLLDIETLQEIENAFKGRWKIKEVMADELFNRISGRRFRYDELKNILLEWIGSEESSIIHVRGKDSSSDIIREELERYGTEGKKIYMDLLNTSVPVDEQDIVEVLDRIEIRGFTEEELLQLLRGERYDHMKRRIRDELFERAWNSAIPHGVLNTDDEGIRDIMKALNLIKKSGRFNGVHLYTEIIVPLSLLTEKLLYENINDRLFTHALLERLSLKVESLLTEYEKRPDRYDGTKDIYVLKEILMGHVVIMDGLRYDLYLILRDVMIEAGWKIKEYPLRIDMPSTTSKFRELLGIDEETGTLNGKSYSLIKMTEKDVGKRNLRKHLKELYDVKFFHFNFIDTMLHGSTLDLYPLYNIIKREFTAGIIPILKEIGSFYLVSDHGFNDTKDLKNRYRHGGGSVWETILPVAETRL